MRSYRESTARSFLRPTLVMGIPIPALLIHSFLLLGALFLTGQSPWAKVSVLVFGFGGLVSLRIANQLLPHGWEESIIFWLEQVSRRKSGADRCPAPQRLSELECRIPDTLSHEDQILEKDRIRERIRLLQTDGEIKLSISVSEEGARVEEILTSPTQPWPEPKNSQFVYSLVQVPTSTDPLWSSLQFNKLKPPFQLWIRIRGLDFSSSKRRIEHARRRNARNGSSIVDVDSEVTFEDASKILFALSRGEESIVEISLAVTSDRDLDLDREFFLREKGSRLPLLSAMGYRRRFHRSHWVRAVTAADLVPSFLDPKDSGVEILRTVRGNPLYFSPQDPRLEALHWLVVGASGSGKSFFTGLVLKRMVEAGLPMSVLFIDHNRSFRRLTNSLRGRYLEPQSLRELERGMDSLAGAVNRPGSFAGIELSDMPLDEKRVASQILLTKVEDVLRSRETTHPVYVVLDECWNFLRDQPVLVQRAFREFRKLNGAVIAITQSISDFVTDQTGQTIFQNSPIRILLRQGEDLSGFRNALSLNDVELEWLRQLKQVKGRFSECLIKTPFLSRIGRLHPTELEHTLLRTDNLREEIIREARLKRMREAVCASS